MVCKSCGVCCQLFMINLDKNEYDSKRFRTVFESFDHMEFDEAELTGANIIRQNDDGSCFYLIDSKCSIHLTRPQVCRKFFCDSKDEKYKEMIGIIETKKLE